MARTGVEAVRRTKEEHPDLVFMDIQMPEMNGLDAIRLIRAELSLQQLPIIALTALAMPGDREQCLEAGANDYLSKPIQIERLTEMLSAYLQNMHLNSESGKESL
jgi:CheY-like chemotaxis protein